MKISKFYLKTTFTWVFSLIFLVLLSKRNLFMKLFPNQIKPYGPTSRRGLSLFHVSVYSLWVLRGYIDKKCKSVNDLVCSPVHHELCWDVTGQTVENKNVWLKDWRCCMIENKGLINHIIQPLLPIPPPPVCNKYRVSQYSVNLQYIVHD